MESLRALSEARAITRGPKHHFFGYYGIPPWNASETVYACLESDFHDRMPQPRERATIGLINLASGSFEPIATTAAWNLQQGAMIHWLAGAKGTETGAAPGTAPESTLIFNDLDEEGECFRPIVMDVSTGKKRVVPSPVGIGAASPDGRWALGLDYARLSNQRPVVGYAGARDRTVGQRAPEDDGVWRIDLSSGKTDLVLSHAAALAAVPATLVPEAARERPIFFNHTLYNPTGTRFMVFIRYFPEGSGNLDSAVLTADADGSNLRWLVPWGHHPSHFDWYSADDLMITISRPDGGRHYVMIRDTPGIDGGWENRRVISEKPGVLFTEGHPSFAPDRRTFVFDGDASPEQKRAVRLYDMAADREIVLGTFPAAPQFKADVRCDLHPRWNRSGTEVSFDSVHNGDRQVYVIPVG
jgi:hypothetical protein